MCHWSHGSFLQKKRYSLRAVFVIYFSDTFSIDGNLSGAREIAAFPAPLQFFLNYGLGCVFCFGTERGRDAGGWSIAKWQLDCHVCGIFFDYYRAHFILMTTQPFISKNAHK